MLGVHSLFGSPKLLDASPMPDGCWVVAKNSQAFMRTMALSAGPYASALPIVRWELSCRVRLHMSVLHHRINWMFDTSGTKIARRRSSLPNEPYLMRHTMFARTMPVDFALRQAVNLKP